MSSSVDQIKSKIDIVGLVGSYIKLEKAGSNWKGRCPFHNEKTPSFFVSPDRGNYYCFGCQAKGDIFTFVQEFEGVDFLGALKILADRAGVELTSFNKENKTEKDRLFSVLEKATFFYQKKLAENPEAKNYLQGRGVSEKTIDSFRIGFAPMEWRELLNYLSSKDVKLEDMLKVGLIKKKDNSITSGPSAYYDTFRGRIMFPIADSAGRIVGFSGRILNPDANSPKYLNSPDTELFNKSEILFGFDKAKSQIKINDYSILVEGQMDLVMLHQVGLSNAVASSGTALTENHLIKLRRLSNRILMAYDGDSAGFSASSRSSKLALSLGMDLKVVQMPGGVDPADLAKDNVEKLKEIFSSSKHIIDFYTDVLISQSLPPRTLGEEIRKNVLPFVATLSSSIEQAHFIKTIAQKTYIKEEALWEDLKKIGRNTNESPPSYKSPPTAPRRVAAIERKVIGIIWWQKGNKTDSRVVNIDELDMKVRQILGKRYEELTQNLEKEKDLLLFETESYYASKDDLQKELDELLVGLEEESLKDEFGKVMVQLQAAEQAKNSSEVLKYLEECQRISQKINTIKTIRNAYEKK